MIFERVTTDTNQVLTVQSIELTHEPCELEIERVRAWIENRRLADLAGCRTDQPDALARLCLEMADAHPGEVTVLLWNADIARQAQILLKQPETGSVDDGLSTALARCILKAGHSLEEGSNDGVWPAGVREMLQQRRLDHTSYWQAKSTKFRLKPSSYGLKTLPSPHPFFFLSESYSTKRLNGALLVHPSSGSVGRRAIEEKPLACRHLAQAAKEHFKIFLKWISQGDTSSLNYLQLERDHQTSRCERGRRSVQFVSREFGRLLARVVSLVPDGESRSYSLSFLSSKQGGSGHELRLFVTNRPSTSDGVRDAFQMACKIYVYDPNITGNMKHLRVLHEHLPTLSFDHFVTRSFEGDWLADVLSLELDDPEMAAALAGQFIPREVKYQLSSFLNALASGNVNEMRAVAEALSLNEFQGLNERREQLLRALGYAMQDDHVDAMLELKRLEVLEVLDQATIEAMALLKNHLYQFRLANALERRQFGVVSAFCQLLLAVAPRLPASIWAEALGASRTGKVKGKLWTAPSLNWAMREGRPQTVTAILGMFVQFLSFLSDDTMGALLMSADEKGISGVRRALEGHEYPTLDAFDQGSSACSPASSVVFALLVEGCKMLEQAVDDFNGFAVGAIVRRVIAVQQSSQRLPKAEVLRLHKMVQSACKQPLSFCTFVFHRFLVERSAFKLLLKYWPELRQLFVRVQHLLS